MDQKKLKVLFVCIGNSCRSPMAESILKNLIESNKELEWIIDSAALRSWNVGYSPEERCIQILAENGLSSNHIGRKISRSDFYNFDYIFGMDHGNLDELLALAPEDNTSQIELLGNYSSENDKIILDPYFEAGVHGFRRAYEQITDSCKNFVKEILKE